MLIYKLSKTDFSSVRETCHLCDVSTFVVRRFKEGKTLLDIKASFPLIENQPSLPSLKT